MQSVLLPMAKKTHGEAAIGILAICSLTDCNGKAAMGILAICSLTDCNGEAAIMFLAICSHADCTRESAMEFPGHLQPCLLQQGGSHGVPSQLQQHWMQRGS